MTTHGSFWFSWFEMHFLFTAPNPFPIRNKLKHLLGSPSSICCRRHSIKICTSKYFPPETTTKIAFQCSTPRASVVVYLDSELRRNLCVRRGVRLSCSLDLSDAHADVAASYTGSRAQASLRRWFSSWNFPNIERPKASDGNNNFSWTNSFHSLSLK